MSLPYVILGLLQQQERTGYDLKGSIDQCIAHFWQADQAQIYRTLDKLEAQGCIACTVEIQHDRPNRKVYSLTEAGKAELAQWLQTHQPLPNLRDPLLVQLYLAAQLSNQAIIQLLEQNQAAHRKRLAVCEAIDLPALGDSTASREQLMQRLALEWVNRREQAYLDWLEEAIAILQQAEFTCPSR